MYKIMKVGYRIWNFINHFFKDVADPNGMDCLSSSTLDLLHVIKEIHVQCKNDVQIM